MIVEHLAPEFVGGTASLESRLRHHAEAAGLNSEEAAGLIESIPIRLLNANAFFDRLTNLWRYEYGPPMELGGQHLFGSNTWIPVENLFRTLVAGIKFLGEHDRRAYLGRLADPPLHRATLAEFLPLVRLSDPIEVEYEVETGEGQRKADWRVEMPGRIPILLEVKSRVVDLLARLRHFDPTVNGNQLGEPTHDPALLLRSVEEKFPRTNPDQVLQGAWIETTVQQEALALEAAFAYLDPQRVHFTVFGGWSPGIHVLSRRESDAQVLLDVLQEQSSDRHIFRAAPI